MLNFTASSRYGSAGRPLQISVPILEPPPSPANPARRWRHRLALEIGWGRGPGPGGRSGACPASPTTLLSRSSARCRTRRCAGSSASQGRGSRSAPTPTSARNRRRPYPVSSVSPAKGTTTTASVFSTFREEVGLSSTPLPCHLSSRALGYKSILFRQCCAGLLLYAASKPSHAVSDADYIVCNPATRKWTVLPDTGEQHSLIHTCVRVSTHPCHPASCSW